MDKYPQYIVVWSNEGLERIVDIEHVSKNLFFDMIRNANHGYTVNSKLRDILDFFILRAKYNSNRRYEIYALNAKRGIKKEDIEEAFRVRPQTMADTVRKIGIKIYSTSMPETKDIIK